MFLKGSLEFFEKLLLDLDRLILPALKETLIMVFISSFIAIVIGTTLGVALYITKDKGLSPNRISSMIIGTIVNIGRSIPFVILIIALFPVTRFFMRTGIGLRAATFCLTVAAIPFVARIMEAAFNEIDIGVIEAAKSMGATNAQIVLKVLIPESLQSIVANITITIINIVGYSPMASVLGAGGVGSVAINYGFVRRRNDILFVCIIILLILVQIVQSIGNYTARNIVVLLHRFNSKYK